MGMIEDALTESSSGRISFVEIYRTRFIERLLHVLLRYT